MNKITVVIPNYNGMKFLPACLESLKKQDAGTPEYGILVVDDASEDESVAFLKEKYPEVKVMTHDVNRGFPRTVNDGIKEADTPYVILLNNDTKVKSGFIRALFEAIDGKDDVFSVSSRMLVWDDERFLDGAGDLYTVFGWAIARGRGRLAENYDKPYRAFSSCGGACIYNKALFETIGYFDESHYMYLEDLDLGYRANIFGYKNMYCPDANVVHFGSASTGTRYNAKKTALSAANSMWVIYKNMPVLQLLINLPFIFLGIIVKSLFFIYKSLRTGTNVIWPYIGGIGVGIAKPFKKTSRGKKVHFKMSNLTNYLYIEWRLFANIFQFIKKS